jgi:hypothetical protein
LRTRFIKEDQIMGRAIGDLLPPRRAGHVVPFAGDQTLFLSGSCRRWRVRHMVARPTRR